jgi:hypothetical protein
MDQLQDINGGERLLMKAWNDFALTRYLDPATGTLCDMTLPDLCLAFCEQQPAVVQLLPNHWRAHLANLASYGLLSKWGVGSFVNHQRRLSPHFAESK